MAFLLDAKTGEVRPVERVTHDSIAWEQIPEQTLCICAHPKATHRYLLRPACSTSVTLRAGTAVGPLVVRGTGCRCPEFQDVDARMPHGNFFDRLLLEFSEGDPNEIDLRPNEKARARTALWWAWRQSGLDFEALRPWFGWLHDSKRVWRAWREAGSPIVAFGKQVSFGVCSIPVLEDR